MIITDLFRVRHSPIMNSRDILAVSSWMSIRTKEGTISLTNETPDSYIGVYQPRDGRDRLLYTLPESGISVLNVIPPVRNKVNSTDLCGPSSQPKWVDGSQTGRLVIRFE